MTNDVREGQRLTDSDWQIIVMDKVGLLVCGAEKARYLCVTKWMMTVD